MIDSFDHFASGATSGSAEPSTSTSTGGNIVTEIISESDGAINDEPLVVICPYEIRSEFEVPNDFKTNKCTGRKDYSAQRWRLSGTAQKDGEQKTTFEYITVRNADGAFYKSGKYRKVDILSSRNLTAISAKEVSKKSRLTGAVVICTAFNLKTLEEWY